MIEHKAKKKDVSWVLYVGTYPPRECGIATFTKDLARAMENLSIPVIKSKILAMNDNGTNIYNYPEEVVFQISDADIQEFIDIAKKINETDSIKLINIQHEFGIFGDSYGSYLIPFLELLNKPAITTFHTVLPNPDEKRKKIVQSIAEKSACLVVMTNKAVEILRNDYGLNKTDIAVIPHGVPSVLLNPDNIKEKTELGFKGKTILSSFGMLNSGKGYEYVIDALPEVIEKFPNVMYLIIGETHPIVRKKEGEEYRKFLEQRIKDLGLKNHVKFYNKYIKLSEIIKYLKATDIYISSSINPDQIVSGTLAYAMGCGKAIVSTPFLHAKEAITPERGMLIDEFKNPKLFSTAILGILSNPALKKRMEENVYSYSRSMTWQNVALSYLKIFEKYVKVTQEYEKTPYSIRIPKVKLDHLVSLTDEFGVIQFAIQTKADTTSGYTLDDNSRAIMVCVMYYDLFRSKSAVKLIRTYLNFIKHVQKKEDGRFYNFVSYAKEVNYERWSEDSHGRTLKALGYIISLESLPQDLRDEAEQLFVKGATLVESIKSPRAVASSIAGLYLYDKAKPSPENVSRIRQLADHLVSLYYDHSSDQWQWFEEFLTYSNSRLPESLFYSHLATKDERYLKVAESTLNFLISITFEKGMFAPIGQIGWYFKNGKRAYFDQQPTDTASMVQTLIVAYDVTKKEEYNENAINAFQWFLGKNFLNQVIYDETTGGCHDGLGESSVNLNEGAESTISYLTARISLINSERAR